LFWTKEVLLLGKKEGEKGDNRQIVRGGLAYKKKPPEDHRGRGSVLRTKVESDTGGNEWVQDAISVSNAGRIVPDEVQEEENGPHFPGKRFGSRRGRKGKGKKKNRWPMWAAGEDEFLLSGKLSEVFHS